jgi:hypothetical protein
MSNHTEAACSALIEAAYPLFRPQLRLLGDLLAGLRRLIDQGGSVIVFLALSDKRQPSTGHIEKGTFALGIGSLLSKPNTLSRVRPIFSGIRHTQLPGKNGKKLQVSKHWELRNS